MIALFVLGVLFVVFLIWIILSIILYKFINIKLIENNKKKLPKYIGFPLSAFIVVFITSCFTFGWGWFVPYSFQPSYWKFRSICKLNELPNNEEKYNKILSYFDTSLDTLDWKELNKQTWKIPDNSGDYKKGVFEYATISKSKEINSRLGMAVVPFSNESKINRYNITAMSILATWHTRRYILDSDLWFRFYWRETTLSCDEVVKENMIPKGESHE